MSNNPVDLLFSDYRRAVLVLRLPRPDDAQIKGQFTYLSTNDQTAAGRRSR